MQVLLFTTINLKSSSLLFLKTQIHSLNGKCIFNLSNKYMDSILQIHNMNLYKQNIKNWFNGILIVLLNDNSKVLNLLSIIKEYNLNLYLISYYINESFIDINKNIIDIILNSNNKITKNFIHLIFINTIIPTTININNKYKYYLYLLFIININKLVLLNNIKYIKCLKIH
jgi:hypothetical protein